MTTRAAADRCPGVLRPHRAADGALLRIRIPGGRIEADALRRLAEASVRYADGEVQLTSRANLQLRGVRTNDDGTVVDGLVDALAGAGLLPHPTHELVRNIVCSPLTGLAGGLADLRPTLAALDAAICAAPDLAALPGPFLFGLDDGRGDVGAERADLAAVAVADDRVRVWAGGVGGPELPLAGAVPTLLGFARRFVDLGPSADPPRWHVREWPGGGPRFLGLADPAVVLPADQDGPPRDTAPAAAGRPPLLGVLGQHDGRMVASALVPLGRLSLPQVSALAGAASAGSGRLIVTPWRGVLVPDLRSATVMSALTARGLIAVEASPWEGITACSGTRCAQATGDTDALARQLVAASGQSLTVPVHVVACPRACGRPSGRHVLATVNRRVVEIRCGDQVVKVAGSQAPDVITAWRGATR